MADIPTLMASCRGRPVTLRMRHGRSVRGRLRYFDAHMNLALEGAEDVTGEEPEELGTVLIRGDNVMAVSLPDDG